MKLLCPACERLTEASGYRIDGGALLLRCSRCGVESASGIPTAEVRSEAPAPAAQDLRVIPLRPDMATPATVTASMALASVAPADVALASVAPAEAVSPEAPPAGEVDPLAVPLGCCPKCIAPRGPEALACGQCGLVFSNFDAEEHRPSPSLLAGWARLRERWSETAGHDQFLRECMARGELAPAGRLYRIRLAHTPGDALAQRGRDEVVRLAMSVATLSAPAGERSPASSTGWRIGLGVLFAAITIAAFVALLRMMIRM